MIRLFACAFLVTLGVLYAPYVAAVIAFALLIRYWR